MSEKPRRKPRKQKGVLYDDDPRMQDEVLARYETTTIDGRDRNILNERAIDSVHVSTIDSTVHAENSSAEYFDYNMENAGATLDNENASPPKTRKVIFLGILIDTY